MALDMEKLKERFEKRQGRGDRFELKDGENNIRILPPSIQYLSETVDYVAVEFLMHYNLGIEGNKTAATCPKTLGKQHKCPICEAVAKLYKLNTAEDKALASTLRVRKRYLFNVIDLNDKQKGIQIMEVGPKIYEYLVMFLTNPKWGDLLDLDKGRDITITKINAKESGTGYADYNLTPDPNVSSIRADLPKNFKEAITLLSKAIPPIKSFDELKAELEGEEVVEPVEAKEPSSVERTVETTSVKVENRKVSKTEIEEKEGDVPSCFGEQYGPRRPECLNCSVKTDCRTRFLDM